MKNLCLLSRQKLELRVHHSNFWRQAVYREDMGSPQEIFLLYSKEQQVCPIEEIKSTTTTKKLVLNTPSGAEQAENDKKQHTGDCKTKAESISECMVGTPQNDKNEE
jgi:hypothetical protein